VLATTERPGCVYVCPTTHTRPTGALQRTHGIWHLCGGCTILMVAAALGLLIPHWGPQCRDVWILSLAQPLCGGAALCPSCNTDQGVYGVCRAAWMNVCSKSVKPQGVVKATSLCDDRRERGASLIIIMCENPLPNLYVYVSFSPRLCLTEENYSHLYSSTAWEHRSRSPLDRVLSACTVHGTRKVVNYTIL